MSAGTRDEAIVLAACLRLQHTEDEQIVVEEHDLLGSGLLLEAIGSTEGQTATSKILRALNRAVRRGALVRTWIGDSDARRTRYLLPANGEAPAERNRTMEAVDQPADGTVRQYHPTGPAVFTAYEDAIGLLTPLIADQIQQSLERYPAGQILDAMREAVRTNRRNWRSIQRILQNWTESGGGAEMDIEVNREESQRRDQEHLDPDKYRGERHLDRARRLQVRDL
ncbi:MAG: DnaD domain-containing protein [Thermomicrobiales bacterium]